MMRSMKTCMPFRACRGRCPCPLRLEPLEARSTPNNLFAVADAWAVSPAPDGPSAWSPAGLFGESAVHDPSPAVTVRRPDGGRPAARETPAPLDAVPRTVARDPAAAVSPFVPLSAPVKLGNGAETIADPDGGGGGSTAGRSELPPGVLPPERFQERYAHLAGQWWQWAYAIPLARNPVVDTTGAFAAEGQQGHVWFLAGSFGTTVTRTATVPQGKEIFFPVLNIEFDNQLCTEPDTTFTVAELRALARGILDGRANLSADVDGASIPNLDQRFRVESQVFRLVLSDDNLLRDQGCADAVRGNYGPAVADGWHVLLAPPSAGSHTIHFHAEIPSYPFMLDVTYHLTVS